MIINKSNNNLGDLFDVKFKVYYYYSEKGKKVKTISRPINKIFIKQIEKKEFDGKFQDTGLTIGSASFMVSFTAGICSVGLTFICPIAAIGALGVTYLSGGVAIGSFGALLTKSVSEYLINKEFNEQKVIDELIIEEDNL